MAKFFRPKDFLVKGPWLIVNHREWSWRMTCRTDQEAHDAWLRLREMAKFRLLEVGFADVKWACGLDEVAVDCPNEPEPKE